MLLPLGLIAALSTAALAAAPSDVAGSAHRTAIEYLYGQGIMESYPDGTFRPDNPVTRAELMKIVVGAAGAEPGDAHGCFPDVADEWFAPFVCYAKAQGWVSGYGDGLFWPGRPVSMAEALKMTLNALRYAPATLLSSWPYRDADLDAWYAPYVRAAFSGHLLDWIGGDLLHPGEPITRGGVSEILYRILHEPEVHGAASASASSWSDIWSNQFAKRRGGGGGGGGGQSPGSSSSTALCGNTAVEGGETCDDGNAITEDCNYGLTSCTVCDDTCHLAAGSVSYCQDGEIDVAHEDCDDGDASNGDGCSTACDIESGWDCSGASSACETVCGDGVVAGTEACDDGDQTPGDGCNAACNIESGYECSGSPSSCTAVCGDGLITGAETCDDGNVTSSDGCNAACNVEAGYSCFSTPSICGGTCGDGIRVGFEQCDDHNTANGDGCSSTCNLELFEA